MEENESKNKFLKELKKNLSDTDETDGNIIENYYKNAQISTSKGNNKAIKKYQKKTILPASKICVYYEVKNKRKD